MTFVGSLVCWQHTL